MSAKATARVSKAAADVTTAYGGWDSPTINCTGCDFVRLYFTYVHSDATSLEFYIQVSADGGSTWFEDHKIDSGTGSLNEVTFTSATTNFSHSVAVEDFNALRVRAKQTGGSATGNTLALSYSSGTAGR